MDNSQAAILEWSPTQVLKPVSGVRVKYSRGFLQCNPAKWFPVFADKWATLINTFGVDLKINQISPTINVTQTFQHGFVATVDQEPLVLGLEHESFRLLVDAFGAGVTGMAKEVLAEYLARRFLKSLGDTWTGPATNVYFEPEFDIKNARPVATVEVKGSINGNSFTLFVFIGKQMLDRLDGLWRRQLHAGVLQNNQTLAKLEIAAMWIAPHKLAEYLVAGALINLQQQVSDEINLVVNNQPWKRAKMFNMQNKLALEVDGFPNVPQAIPGATRLAFEYGAITIDAQTLAELAQAGAILETELALQPVVNLVINNQRVAVGKLGIYQGRLVVTVTNPV